MDKRANNLQTPLMWAITRGHVQAWGSGIKPSEDGDEQDELRHVEPQVCKILLQAKADPVAKETSRCHERPNSPLRPKVLKYGRLLWIHVCL